MAVSLFPHNQTAYENVCAMLEKTGKAAVIHPTGTGKSFIGFKYAEDHPQERILWLAPSEYIFKTQLENWKSAGGCDLPNITFLTYAKLSLMPEEEILKLVEEPNVSGSSTKRTSSEVNELSSRLTEANDTQLVRTLIVLDEFHRAGATHWGLGLERLLKVFPDATIIGLTATAVRYLDSQRDMAQELFDGHIASEMTLGEAVVRGILPAPKYVLSIFKYKDDLAKYELRARRAKSKATRDAAEEILEKLRRALDLAEGLEDIFDRHMEDRTGKYLVFCANAEHMRDMISRVPDWFYKVDEHPHVYSAYSEDPETDRAFADFKADTSDHLKLLFCIDMLNEGIHVPDVSGVILLRPTVSPIVYKQQIGRALSASHSSPSIEEETQGTVFCVPRENTENCSPVSVPVIFDIVLNIENLYSISSVQEEIEAAVTYYRSLGISDQIVTDSFEVVDEVHDCLELFDRLNDTLTASWDIMYDVAKGYREEFGDLEVPARYVTKEGYSLGQWIDTQRKIRKGTVKGTMTPEQIRKLDELGMRWESAADQSWERYYAAAKQYYAEYGDLRVPWRYVTKDGIPLADWIANMRMNRRNGIRNAYLTDERIAALDALGMQWDVLDYLFERNYASAVEYHRTHGNLDVPAAYVDPGREEPTRPAHRRTDPPPRCIGHDLGQPERPSVGKGLCLCQTVLGEERKTPNVTVLYERRRLQARRMDRGSKGKVPGREDETGAEEAPGCPGNDLGPAGERNQAQKSVPEHRNRRTGMNETKAG